MVKPIGRRIYELTLTYQRLYPKKIPNQKSFGRVYVKKRANTLLQ